MRARRCLPGAFAILTIVGRTADAGVAFVSPHFQSAIRQRGVTRSLTTRIMALEVEQKFHLSKATSDLETKLRTLGFQPMGNVKFVDWYFDNDDNYLSTRDCWLRFREKSGVGQWELKRGRGHQGTTVYEEIEGDSACSEAVAALKKGGYYTTSNDGQRQVEEFDGFAVPKMPVPDAYGLRPFCRLETTRSSWSVESSESPYAGLSVDLDATNTGHTVGEVETLCDEGSVDTGMQRVQGLIAELVGNEGESGQPAIGKLEHYLLNNRPDHYAACVESGVIRNTRE